ncbi:hypothetical protein LQ318_05050 [Aliifodinibius salicampi]|uniref:Transposase IS200-like domain-containing protein n=1 Tax=Fodinibius salicampi TaxID=1920655 RepID=A0ABT3PWP5_9BACT|nr:hypothetical protein [Fodinibius salicampi]MCW9712270.1 hypothetical protein [Fodinibius salicampi]
MCTHNRVCLFGEINDGNMVLNEWGRIARGQWLETESIRDNVILDAFVIMPNHVHGIIQITHSNRNTEVDNDGPYDVGAYRNTPQQNDSPQQNRNTPQQNQNTHLHHTPITINPDSVPRSKHWGPLYGAINRQ